MRRRANVFIFLFCVTINFSSCGKSIDVSDTVTGIDYGEWEFINSIYSHNDNQFVSSISGYKISNQITVELGAEWKSIVLVSLGYQTDEEALECSAVSTHIFKDETIDFYCRPVYDIHNIEKVTYKNTNKDKIVSTDSIQYPVFHSIEYGWIIYDKNHNIIENTTCEPPLLRVQASTQTPIDGTNNTIEDYIIKSFTSEISIDELSLLSDTELRLIRNGIFAFCGRDYQSNPALYEYYCEFSWYNPKIAPSDFKWETFNITQQNTIANIRKIEKSRKSSS